MKYSRFGVKIKKKSVKLFVCCFVAQISVKRNKRGEDKIYVGPDNKGYSTLSALYKTKVDAKRETSISIEGVQGMVLITEENIQLGK